MRASITKTEAVDLIKRMWYMLRTPSSTQSPLVCDLTDITIDDSPLLCGVMNPVEAIMRVTTIEYPNYLTNQKIPAIKKMREYHGDLGLAEAKYCVEHPAQAIHYYLTHGHLKNCQL